MKLFELLRSRSVLVLMMSFMALAILPACSSSEEASEAPPAQESSSSDSGSGCGDPDDCPDGDEQCKEAAIQSCNF